MKKLALTLSLLFCLTFMSGCYTHVHTVGNGGSGNVQQTKQWYVLFGLVPINNVDTKAMAGGATDYTITTQHSFIDLVIGAFTGIVSVYPKTVKVEK